MKVPLNSYHSLCSKAPWSTISLIKCLILTSFYKQVCCLLARAHPWLQTWTLTKAKEHLYIGLPRCSVHSSQIISWTAPTEVT